MSQDPNDEPASVLLERIREEKARKAAERKTILKQIGKSLRGKPKNKVPKAVNDSVQ